MNFCDINHFIRFASLIHFDEYTSKSVMVKDCRIFFTLSGEAELSIENQHYILTPGSLFYCRAGSLYTIRSTNAHLISLNFDLTHQRSERVTAFSPVDAKDGITLPEINWNVICNSDFINSHLFLSRANDFKKSLEKILDEFSTQKIFYSETSSALLKGILTQLHRRSIDTSTNSSNAVSKTIAYIKTNYDKPLTNDMISNLTGYHEYHLNRLFLKHTGTSLHKYMLNIRINEAKNMLLNTDLSLTSISEKVGFNSNTYFSTYFKQTEGFSPLEFRKRFKNKI